MNPLKNRLRIINLVLLLPALLFTASGILYLACRIEGANRFLELCLSYPAGKLLLSPVVVLGGPLVALAINAWQVFHFSADVVNEEFVIALSVKRIRSPLLSLALAGGLILLLATYAFVENFQIVVR